MCFLLVEDNINFGGTIQSFLISLLHTVDWIEGRWGGSRAD
jgi:hypothetical protein